MQQRNEGRACRILKSTAACLAVGALGVGVCVAAAATPATLGTAAATFAGGVLGNFGFETVRRWWHACGDRTGSGIDENHVILRALRRAQLFALKNLLRDWSATPGHADDAEWPGHPREFSNRLRDYIADEETAAKTLIWDALPEPDAASIEALKVETIRRAPADFNTALAARHGTGGAIAAWREPAEQAVLAELRANLSTNIPKTFERSFLGGRDGEGGWFSLFIRDAAARVRENPEFARIWNAEQVATLRALTADMGADVRHLLDAQGEATEWLERYGTALDAIAGSVDATNEVVRRIDAALRAASSGERNWLRFNIQISTQGWLRFSPYNPRVPFQGRAAQLDELHRFLRDGRPFAWWMATGPGGAGKTRLALELCWRAHAAGWQVGFLRRSRPGQPTKLPDFAWRPGRPTLIVADYASEQVNDVATLAATLTELTDPDAPVVRLLMLERQADEQFWKRFLGPSSGESGALERGRFAADPLQVPELSDDELWNIVSSRPWQDDPTKLPTERHAFFDRLMEIDGQRRPLVAMILADAPALGSGLKEILSKLITLSRALYWPKDLPDDADLLIAAATMIGRLDGDLLRLVEKERGRKVRGADLHGCARAIGTRQHTEARRRQHIVRLRLIEPIGRVLSIGLKLIGPSNVAVRGRLMLSLHCRNSVARRSVAALPLRSYIPGNPKVLNCARGRMWV